MHAQLLSRVLLFVTLWTVAHQAVLSMEFSRQDYWSGLPFSSPGDPLRDWTYISVSSALAGGFFTSRITWETHISIKKKINGKNKTKTSTVMSNLQK